MYVDIFQYILKGVLMSPTERLKEVRKSLGLTQEKFGEQIGLKQSQMRDIESGKQKVSVEIAEIIEKIFNIDAGWLIFGKGQMTTTSAIVESNDDYQVELLTLKASAGYGNGQHLIESDGKITIAKCLFKTVQKPDKLKACHVCGTSMEPRLYSGDIVIFEESGYIGTGIYVLFLNGEYLVKRLEQMFDGGMMVVSLNPQYPTQIANDMNGYILGRMLLAISKE
jgi:phage repressor protein C with HTH and peptisase S24 domain